jgi:hypothetical protein
VPSFFGDGPDPTGRRRQQERFLEDTMAENKPTQSDTDETEGAEVEGHVLDSQDLGPKGATPESSCISLVSSIEEN